MFFSFNFKTPNHESHRSRIGGACQLDSDVKIGKCRQQPTSDALSASSPFLPIVDNVVSIRSGMDPQIVDWIHWFSWTPCGAIALAFILLKSISHSF